ncbi:phage integrase SAM-like domain-containing protein [Phocaeicola plebeius]|uniref:phage integrase SAM-like domain-containing protein n=1 Tax=Phocaeicola plebeius TaxID=310297 RepID=UPI0015F5B2EB
MLKKEHDIPLEQIRPSHIHQYQNFLEKRELSSTTVRIYLTLIKVIYVPIIPVIIFIFPCILTRDNVFLHKIFR